MANPKLYFILKDKVFVPQEGQSTLLDKMFQEKYVLESNKDSYNEYTRNMANEGFNNSLYWSDAYSFNKYKFTFNFAELHRIDLVLEPGEIVDVEQVNTHNENFDVHSDYELPGKDIDKRKDVLTIIKHNYPCPTISDSGFYIEERNWNFLVRNIIKHINTILIGPTGTGKTEIVQRICDTLGISCHVYDMGSMQDPLTDLLGSHRLENGSSIFDYAKFVSDIQQPGVILLDELSRAPLTANNILFPCLDSRRTLPVEIADSKSDRVIKVHPECTFVATANIGSEYTGTQEIDSALLNRFLPLQLDYLPKDIEAKVLIKRTGIDAKTAEKLINFANKVRENYMTGALSKSVSTRETLACAELVVDGFAPIDAIDFIITNKFINNNYNTEYSDVKKLIIGF